MCGRFNADQERLHRQFVALVGTSFPGEDNCNTAPTEPAWIIRSKRRSDELEAAHAKWWLTPYWSKVATPKHATFNARSETLARSRTFREPFARRRCIVPASGFYEWRTARGARQPYYIRPRSGALLFAGVWDRWRSRTGDATIESFAIVTAPACDELRFIHDRQPMMLSENDAAHWLDREAPAESLDTLFAPRLPEDLEAVPVSSYVNNARNKGPRCHAPTGAPIALEPGLAHGDPKPALPRQGEMAL
jgi:putative SOS response-associated peptidase YedK